MKYSFVVIVSLFILGLIAPSTVLAQTTIYIGALEKILDTGEIKVISDAGTVLVVKTIQTDGTNTLAYVHSDHLGSTSLVTDDKGNKLADIKYYPYGDEIAPIPSTVTASATDRLYTGQRQDTDIDIYFYNARYYNPTTAKFLSADKAEGPNRYAYVNNNPVMRNDPSGNCPMCISGAVGAIGGFFVGGGINVINQLNENGGDWSQVKWGDAAKSGGYGAVAGALIGATFGAAAGAVSAAGGIGVVASAASTAAVTEGTHLALSLAKAAQDPALGTVEQRAQQTFVKSLDPEVKVKDLALAAVGINSNPVVSAVSSGVDLISDYKNPDSYVNFGSTVMKNVTPVRVGSAVYKFAETPSFSGALGIAESFYKKTPSTLTKVKSVVKTIEEPSNRNIIDAGNKLVKKEMIIK